MRILHVDGSNARHLEMVLTCRPHEIVVHFAESGDEAISILTRDAYDVVIIAPGLEDFDGHELVRRLRTCRVRTPIILVGQDTTPQWRTRALWDGADDTMNMPWDHHEMIARLKSLERRAHGHSASRVRVGQVTIDQESMRVMLGESPLHVTEKEYQIVELLAMRIGRVCTKADFMNHLYGGMDEPEEKIIDVLVCRLRKKLALYGVDIKTVWGRGYILEHAASPASAAA